MKEIRTFIYHTKEGDFEIPRQWKEMLGEDCLAKKISINKRLKQLGYSLKNCARTKKVLERLVGLDFTKFCIKSEQIALGYRDTKSTCLLKYGIETPVKLKSTIERRKKTLLSKYGVDNPAKLTKFEITERLKLYCLRPLDEIKDCTLFIQHKAICLSCGNTIDFHFISHGVPSKCPFCNSRSTNFERSLVLLLQTKFDNVIPHYRAAFRQTEFSRSEIDIYVPILGLGIEVNGIASHNSTINVVAKARGTNQTVKSKTYHLSKTETSLSVGIELIHIWEHEPWKTKGLEFLKLRLENKHLDFIDKVKQFQPDKFKLRRDFYPVAPEIPGYTHVWKPEIWHTDKSGKSLQPEDPKALATYTSGIWVYTKYDLKPSSHI